VDLKHIIQDVAGVGDLDTLEIGIELKDFYPSVEWDLLGVPAKKNEKYYTCCSEPYPDITFNITIRRKTLFHTVNLIIPCIAITFLTTSPSSPSSSSTSRQTAVSTEFTTNVQPHFLPVSFTSTRQKTASPSFAAAANVIARCVR